MSKKQYTHKRLDELFNEIRIYYAGITGELKERLEYPLKQFGVFGNPVKATAAKNLKNKEDCLVALNSFGMAKADKLFSLTMTVDTAPHVYATRKEFARVFNKLLAVVFQETGKTIPDAPCYKLPRVANLMMNKRTGKDAFDIDSIIRVVSEYEKHEHRDMHPSPQHHQPRDDDGGMGKSSYTKNIAIPPTEKPFILPIPPTGFPNAATQQIAAFGGRRKTRRRQIRRRKTTYRR
jgi:hypothetical protein